MWVWLSTRPGRIVRPRRSRSPGLKARGVELLSLSSSRWSIEVIKPLVLEIVREMFFKKVFALESKKRDVWILYVEDEDEKEEEEEELLGSIERLFFICMVNGSM